MFDLNIDHYEKNELEDLFKLSTLYWTPHTFFFNQEGFGAKVSRRGCESYC